MQSTVLGKQIAELTSWGYRTPLQHYTLIELCLTRSSVFHGKAEHGGV